MWSSIIPSTTAIPIHPLWVSSFLTTFPSAETAEDTPVPSGPHPASPAGSPCTEPALTLHTGHAIRLLLPGGCPTCAPNVTDFGAPCLPWSDVLPLLERPPPAVWTLLRGQRHNFCQSRDGADRPLSFYPNARWRGLGDWANVTAYTVSASGGGTQNSQGAGLAWSGRGVLLGERRHGLAWLRYPGDGLH